MSVVESAELGDWTPVEALEPAERQQLEAYPLWPDLEAAFLEATIRDVDADTVTGWLDEHGTLKPARALRYHWALELVRRDDLDAYQDLYVTWYRDLGIAKLDCLNLQAEIAAGRGDTIAERGKALWLTGDSQADECDPVFKVMQARNELGIAEYRQRFDLAIEAEEYSRARWLAKSIDDAHVALATRWLDAQANPADFLKDHRSHDDSELATEQLAYAAERLTYRDPLEAKQLWATVVARHDIPAAKRAEVDRHIALWMARDNLPGAYPALAALPDSAADDEVRRWQARASLRDNRWSGMLDAIAALSSQEQDREEWQYWRAVAINRSGNDATDALKALAAERSYYGFLAADELELPYAFGHADLPADEAAIEELSVDPAFVRARELFFVGLDSRGRSEWDAAVSGLVPEKKIQAALLADRWGWHSRAIATVALVEEYDDLNLRYPLPYAERFRSSAGSANIDATWAYGIARSESLFMRDVRSGAGAVGLMQILPSTGREIAKRLSQPWAGIDTLTDPEASILLGSAYLAQMAERFGGNEILATAAYNAGPHRVDAWLPSTTAVDAKVWIENIPYNETRAYVRRVMEAETIFHWRLTGETRRLSESLVAVEPAASKDQRVASSSR